MAEHNGYAGGVNPYDAATLSLFAGGGYGRGGGIFGRGYIGDDVISAKGFANGTAENAKLDKIQEDIRVASDRQTDLLRDRQFQDIAVSQQDIRREIVEQAGQNRVEVINRVNSVNQNICDLSKELAECCCEIKTEVLKENSATRELINSRALSEAERALDKADRDSNTNALTAALQQQTAMLSQLIQSTCGHHHWPRGGRSE